MAASKFEYRTPRPLYRPKDEEPSPKAKRRAAQKVLDGIKASVEVAAARGVAKRKPSKPKRAVKDSLTTAKPAQRKLRAKTDAEDLPPWEGPDQFAHERKPAP